MTRLRNGTWILVADGEKALFLENVTDSEDPHLEVRRVEEHENPPDREQASDRPGRMRDSVGPQPDVGAMQRSGMGEVDFHKLEKDRFADDLADLLYRQAHRHRFERLVLVAAPNILGALRGKLHKEVSDRVVAEVGKNLTNHPMPEIERLVSEALAEQG